MPHFQPRLAGAGILRRENPPGVRAMQYRHLGKSPLKVSTLCLGTMMFGDQTDAKVAGEIVAHAREHGVNFIDTADVYSTGKSEQMVGALLKGQRHDWIVATKLGNKMS